MTDKQLIELTVNGATHELIVEPRRTLVDVLRHDLRLTGTHVGCEHGVCGACTVLIDGQPARACLTFAAQVENTSVRTVEDLATDGELNDLQQAFVDHHGLQWFLHTGFLMLAEGYLAERPDADKEEIREVVASNYCRCTGYQTIVEAIDACAIQRRRGGCSKSFLDIRFIKLGDAVILNNTLDIDASPEEVFRLINDVEKVATCVPGAAITGKDGDTYRGGVKVKVGPISAAYAGTIRFLDIDEASQTLKLEAKGADSHGNGDAEAQVDLSVEPVGDGSRLVLRTDLVISGKIVAFGKGAIVAVSNKVLQQFAVNLGVMLAGGDVPAATGETQQLARTGAAADVEFNALSMLPSLPAPMRKYAPLAAVFTAGMLEGWLISRAFGRR